jgi:Vitamin K-dependent gamma-carboxylase
VKEKLAAFFFPAESDSGLTILRLGLALQTLLYAVSLRADWNYLFGGKGEGLNGRALAEALLSIESPIVPRLGWFVTLGSYVGVSQSTVLSVTWWLLFGAAIGLLVGFFSRVCAIAIWLLHLCAAKSGGLVSYGVDNFMTIGLFYLVLSPLPDRRSVDHVWRDLSLKNGDLLGFFRRVLQLHLPLMYFFGGLTKCLGSGWWDGSNIWRALTRPPFNIISPDILVSWKYVFPIAGISVCLLEIGYPVFIWQKPTRGVWLILVLGMHVAIGLTMGMYLFALIMIVLNLAAFGPDLPAIPRRQTSFRLKSATS